MNRMVVVYYIRLLFLTSSNTSRFIDFSDILARLLSNLMVRVTKGRGHHFVAIISARISHLRFHDGPLLMYTLIPIRTFFHAVYRL